MLGPLSPAEFLARYWQREPLPLPGALPGFPPPLTPDELAGLACEEGVESRLVLGNLREGFRLEHGPFDEERFARLPERDWTLLVQDVDKHVPEVARLLLPFRFLPDWRIDDIMVSFAAPGGSVGPHTDQYDVFLLQARGRRRWQLSQRFAPELRSDCELKVLAEFEPERELVAEPGDLLYLPPNVAHFGIAEGEAMTFSIGFRAPDRAELVRALLRELGDDAHPIDRFSDPGRAPAQDPAELAAEDLGRLRQLVRRGLSLSDAELDAFIGRYLTRSKPHLEAAGQNTTPSEVRRRLAQGEPLLRRHGSHWSWSARGSELWVFAEGYQVSLRERQRTWLAPLLAGEALTLASLRGDEGALEHLARWLEQGALEWQSEAWEDAEGKDTEGKDAEGKDAEGEDA